MKEDKTIWTRQNAGKAAAFLLLVLLLLTGISKLFVPKDNTPESGMEDTEANGILAEPENTIDLLILGDSETYCGLLPLELWEAQGYTSYVCGTSGQKLYYSYQFLEKALKTQTPKIVILETNAIYRRCSIAGTMTFELQVPFPGIRYHDRWKSLTREDFAGTVDYTYLAPYKGYRLTKKNQQVQAAKSDGYMEASEETKRITVINRIYLDRIRTLCEDNGIEFLLLSTPSTKNWSTARHNGVEAYADKYGLDYLDLNLVCDEIGIDWSNDSRDAGDHLNLNGAQKTTAYLGRWLAENRDLPDHSGDSAFDQWNTALAAYQKELAKKAEKNK